VQRRNSFECHCRSDIHSARYYAGGDGAARRPYHRAKHVPSGTLESLFIVLPASCRQNETMRDRSICWRDAGSTLERRHTAPLQQTDTGWKAWPMAE